MLPSIPSRLWALPSTSNSTLKDSIVSFALPGPLPVPLPSVAPALPLPVPPLPFLPFAFPALPLLRGNGVTGGYWSVLVILHGFLLLLSLLAPCCLS